MEDENVSEIDSSTEVEEVVEDVEQLKVSDVEVAPEDIKSDNPVTKKSASASATKARKARLSKVKKEMSEAIKLNDLTDAIVTKPKTKRTTVKEVKEQLEQEKQAKEELKAILLNMRAEMDRQAQERAEEKRLKEAKKIAKLEAKKGSGIKVVEKSAKELEMEKNIALYRQKILGIH